MEKAPIFGVFAALAALAGDWYKFVSFGLPVKLALIGLAVGLGLYCAAKWFAERLRPGARPWFPPDVPRAAPSRLWFALYALALAAICVFGVLLARLQIDRSTLRMLDVFADKTSSMLLTAPDLGVANITVELPPKKDGVCEYKNRSRDETPPLNMMMIDLDTSTPRIQISNFVRPQRLEIDCTPAAHLKIFAPAGVEIYADGVLLALKRAIYAVGAMLWLVACLFVWRLSL